MSNRFRAVNKLQKIRRNGFNKLKPPWPTIRNGKARRRFRRGLYDICDDANVRLICPTRQVAKANQIQHSEFENKIVGPWMAQPAAQPSARRLSDVLRCCRAHDSVGLVLCGKPSRDRLPRGHDMPICEPLL